MERIILMDRKGFSTTAFIEPGIHAVNVPEIPKMGMQDIISRKPNLNLTNFNYVEFRWHGAWSTEWKGQRIRIFEEC